MPNGSPIHIGDPIPGLLIVVDGTLNAHFVRASLVVGVVGVESELHPLLKLNPLALEVFKSTSAS
jgi:hypothetical protein